MLNAMMALREKVGLENLVSFMWHSYTLWILALGIPVVIQPAWLPVAFRNFYMYGKLRDNGSDQDEPLIIRAMKLPKRTFSHFYVFAVAYHMIVATIIYWSYANGRAPMLVVAFLDVIVGHNRISMEEPLAVMVTAALLLAQVIRRLYECCCVCIYSDGSIFLPHYVVGITFYWGASTSLIAYASGFTRDGLHAAAFLNWNWGCHHLIGVALYVWGAWHQHRCTVILANLRKNDAGEVTSKQHFLPRGDWFENLTCPHMFAEIVIYTAMNVTMGFRNPLFISLLLFVVANQSVVALLNRQWYRMKFKDYPKTRKAILPFLL